MPLKYFTPTLDKEPKNYACTQKGPSYNDGPEKSYLVLVRNDLLGLLVEDMYLR